MSGRGVRSGSGDSGARVHDGDPVPNALGQEQDAVSGMHAWSLMASMASLLSASADSIQVLERDST